MTERTAETGSTAVTERTAVTGSTAVTERTAVAERTPVTKRTAETGSTVLMDCAALNTVCDSLTVQKCQYTVDSTI